MLSPKNLVSGIISGTGLSNSAYCRNVLHFRIIWLKIKIGFLYQGKTI